MRIIFFDFITVFFIMAAGAFMLSGCSYKKKPEPEPVISVEEEYPGPAIEDDDSDFVPGDPELLDKERLSVAAEAIVNDAGPDIVPDEEEDGGDGHRLSGSQGEAGELEAELSEEDHTEEEQPVQGCGIVWLGDSLTQGSLGDMDDNLSNAPYERLAKLCEDRGNVVEGFGYYAYVTSDIFWRYCEYYENGEPKDPEKVYVLWVGSNDFALASDPLSAVAEVEAQIDSFVGDRLKKYIVLSHLPRTETIPGDTYKHINTALKEKYKSRFLDITSCAPFPEGFQGDGVHLTQQSYDKVAEAVYYKLMEMGYI